MSIIYEGHDILIYSVEPPRRNMFYQTAPVSSVVVVDKHNWLRLSDSNEPVTYPNIDCLLLDLDKRATNPTINMFIISNVYANVKRAAKPLDIPTLYGKTTSSCSGASLGNPPGPVC